MVDIICALCGQKQQIEVLYKATFSEKDFSKKTYSARRIPDKIHYRILKCKNCGLIFSSPIFSLEKISKMYGKSECNYKDNIPYLIETYLKLINKIKKRLPKNFKALEVGCGNGFFLKALVDSGLTKKVYGIEPSFKMVSERQSILKEKIKVNIFKPNLFPKNNFDLILCFHTLDHMFDPNEFMNGAYEMLKRGGYLIVVVHDANGLSVKLFGESSPIFDIEHIYLFNKKTLEKISSQANFKTVKLLNISNKYPLNYWIKMSGFPKKIKSLLLKITIFLKIERLPLHIPAGNIAIIAKKE